jgi:hypothetical protein
MAWRTTIYGSMPAFVADPESIDRNTGRQIDWTKIPVSYIAGTSYTITATEPAIATATEITVAALPVALPTGTLLNFAGTGEVAELSAPAAAGATTLTVLALDAAIEDNDTATYIVSASNDKVIPAGTVMCELSTGYVVPRAARPGSEAAIGILWSTATQNSLTDALTGYAIIVGGVIYETLLPETITSYKTELETNGTSWVWETYSDNREV